MVGGQFSDVRRVVPVVCVVFGDPSEPFCAMWEDSGAAVVQQCRGLIQAVLAPFITFDKDGDEDVDLADYTAIQHDFQYPLVLSCA